MAFVLRLGSMKVNRGGHVPVVPIGAFALAAQVGRLLEVLLVFVAQVAPGNATFCVVFPPRCPQHGRVC